MRSNFVLALQETSIPSMAYVRKYTHKICPEIWQSGTVPPLKRILTFPEKNLLNTPDYLPNPPEPATDWSLR